MLPAGSSRRPLLVFLLAVALPAVLVPAEPETAPAAVPAGAVVPKDVRLSRAVTLDDYHPWTPITDRAAWAARAARVREQILVSAGLWPMPPAAPLDPVIHGRIDRDAYTIEKVWFRSHPGHYVTGSLYRPKGAAAGPRPGVLCPHGHWAQGRFYESSEADARTEIEQGRERAMEGARYPLQARCAMLARLGCVVFHYDMVGNADSKPIPHGGGFGDVEAELRLQSAFGLQLYNSIRSLDFLLSLPEVDPARIGVTGASGGGTQTFFLCAVDDRPDAAFPAVMVSTSMQGGCVCENATLLRVGTGDIEFAALTAPRPLGMTGANDWTIEIETKGLPELKALWTALGVPDLVDAKCWSQFPHNYNLVSRERMYTWFNRHLRLGRPDPVVEEPFVPVPPRELSVFDADHPRPSDALEVGGLRKVLTEVSDRQMAALAPSDRSKLEEFRRVVGGALRAIACSELPTAEDLAPVRRIETPDLRDPPGARKDLLVLGQKGSGEAVPAVWIVPRSWSGTVVVAVTDDASRSRLGLGGDVPVGPARAWLEAGAAVLAPEVLLTGRLVPGEGDRKLPVDGSRHARFPGYTYGYNRTLMAQRVHDVLTAVGHARTVNGSRAVHLVGAGEGGLWALLAKGLAGSAVGRTVVERPGFDFADVQNVDDPRFLPGGLKYGGWGAFAALASPDPLVLVGSGAIPGVLTDAYAAAGAADRLRATDAAGAEAALRDIVR